MSFRPRLIGNECSIAATRPRGFRLKSCALRVIAIAAVSSSPILAGCRPALAQVRAPTSAGAALPRPPFVLAQAQPAPAVPVAPAPAPEQPIGLPRVRDYEPIPELWDIYFDSGKAKIRPDDVTILNANAAWLVGNPDYLVLIEGHSDSRGSTNRKSERNMALGERRAQAAMAHLVARGVHPRRITILSYGAERPQCIEETEQCWGQNRRSRFLVKPRE
jgi:peptidoglycan-associated lipoprotein